MLTVLDRLVFLKVRVVLENSSFSPSVKSGKGPRLRMKGRLPYPSMGWMLVTRGLRVSHHSSSALQEISSAAFICSLPVSFEMQDSETEFQKIQSF